MNQPRSSTDIAEDPTPERGPAPPTYPGLPRWVKMGAIASAVLIALVVLVMLATGQQHGPMRHIPSGSGPTMPTALVLLAHR